jgi:hypothetical protein
LLLFLPLLLLLLLLLLPTLLQVLIVAAFVVAEVAVVAHALGVCKWDVYPSGKVYFYMGVKTNRSSLEMKIPMFRS